MAPMASDGPSAGPRVSVIVPVRDRRELLRKLLDGLKRQTFDDFELIVVDDGSSDGSAELVEQQQHDRWASKDAPSAVLSDDLFVRIGGRVRLIRQEPAGAVAAREAGLAAAVGDVLAFTDSDCVPDPQWLAAGVAAIDAGADVVTGCTRPERPPRSRERTLGSEDNGLYPTCNVFYRRTAFDAAGGFEAELGDRYGFRPGERAKHLGFGEDTLLGWRVCRAGSAVYEPAALVDHAVFPPDLRDHLSRTLQAAGFPALVREVPELRRTLLTQRVFLGRPRTALYVLLLAALLRGRAIALISAAWWVRGHWMALSATEPSRRDRVAALPLALLTDLITAGSLVVGSASARSVVL